MQINELEFIMKIKFLLIFSIILFIISISTYFRNSLNVITYNRQQIKTSQLELDQNILEEPKPMVRILIMADTHLNSNAFQKIKNYININPVDFVVHLGDHTDYGEIDKLKKAQMLLESLEVSYVALPGDRDLGASGGKKNFSKVFKYIEVLEHKDLNFLFIDNSANFTPINVEDFQNYMEKIKSADVVFLSQPIKTKKGSIFEEKYMGSIEDKNFIQNHEKELLIYKEQRDTLLQEIRNSKTKYVIAGDHHKSSNFNDEVKNDLKFHILGGLSEYISFGSTALDQNALQSRRFSLLDFYENKRIEIKEILLE
jgi:predicted phosphodiesterase